MKVKSVIRQMFYAQRGDCEHVKSSHEYIELIGIVDELYDKLCEKIKTTPEIWELFLKYKDSLENAHIEQIDNFYEEGFKFGLLMGIEAGESKFEE